MNDPAGNPAMQTLEAPAQVVAQGKACLAQKDFPGFVNVCRRLLLLPGKPEVDDAVGVLVLAALRQADDREMGELEDLVFTLPRLAAGWNPRNVALAYLKWKYRILFGPDCHPEPAQIERYIGAVRALWPVLDGEQRLQHRLHLNLAIALSALQQREELEILGKDTLAGWRGDPRYEPALDGILRRLAKLQAGGVLRRLLPAVLDAPQLSTTMTGAVIEVLAVLSRMPAAIEEHQAAASHLRLLGSVKDIKATLPLRAHPQLAGAAQRYADFNLLREWLCHAMGLLDQPSVRQAALSALKDLMVFDPGEDVAEMVAAAHLADPGDARGALLRARLLMLQHVPLSEIEPLLRDITGADSDRRSAQLWLARRYEIEGETLSCLRWLDETALLHDPSAGDIMTRIDFFRLRLPMPIHGGELAHRLATFEALFADLLEPLCRVVNGDLTYASEKTADELRIMLQAGYRRLADALEARPCLDLGTLCRVVQILARTAYDHFGEIVHQQRATQVPHGPQYGALDPARLEVTLTSLYAHAAELAAAGLHMALTGADTTDLRLLCRLAEFYTQCHLEMGSIALAQPMLMKLYERGIGKRFIARMLERCALELGDLDAARSWVDQADHMRSDLHRTLPFDRWCEAEHLQPTVLLHDPGLQCRFDYCTKPDTLRSAQHRVMPTTLSTVSANGLTVRDSELLIGHHGTVLRPHPWHLRDYFGYPEANWIVLNSAHGGCRLVRAQRRLRHIREPILVLANMDAIVYRNFYHWMILILPRINLAVEKGLLEERRLLLPAELTVWMRQSLDLLGISPDQIVTYCYDDAVLLDNALVVSSLEFASSFLLKSLRQRLWQAADVSPVDSTSKRFVWLSRRNHSRRALTNLDAVEELVRDYGLAVVAPEDLSLIDQIRLCGGAAGIAGVVGANLTNLMVAAEGTRVLGLCGQDEAIPTYPDLCGVMGFPQRWIFGRNDPRNQLWGPIHQPFEVDIRAFEQGLRWLVCR